MIRNTNINDIGVCFDLAQEIYGPFMKDNGIEMVEDDLKETVKYFILSGQSVVVEHNGKVCGMAAWIVTAHPANSKAKIWQEVLWCLKTVYKTDALALIRAMEDKAKEADVMVVANLSFDNEAALRRIYSKRGFNFLESHFSRRRRI